MAAKPYVIVVAISFAMAIANSGCSTQPQESKYGHLFCHGNGECGSGNICSKDIAYWRPPDTPADAGICVEATVAGCPQGYDLSGGRDPLTGYNKSFCIAGPIYCHTDTECPEHQRCDKHTETFIPKSVGEGAGVCMVGG